MPEEIKRKRGRPRKKEDDTLQRFDDIFVKGVTDSLVALEKQCEELYANGEVYDACIDRLETELDSIKKSLLNKKRWYHFWK